MNFDIVTLATIAVLHHRSEADPDKDYDHKGIVSNYKYCKDLLDGLVKYSREITKEKEILENRVISLEIELNKAYKKISALRNSKSNYDDYGQ